MNDLLTRERYGYIATNLTYPTLSFIDGRFRPALSGKTLPTVNPATGEILAEIAACGAEDVDFAVQKAREAFDDGRWSRLDPAERKAVLLKFGELIQRDRRELAVLESLDSGKPIADCVTIDVPETIHAIKWHAESIDKIYDQTAPVGPNAVATVVREPIGRHMDVDMVSFTGSTATGRRFLNYAAESNFKKVVLECGGKNPCIVLDDAEDLDRVAEHVVAAAFWNMGENRSAGSGQSAGCSGR